LAKTFYHTSNAFKFEPTEILWAVKHARRGFKVDGVRICKAPEGACEAYVGSEVSKRDDGTEETPRKVAEIDLLEVHKSKGAAGNVKSKQDLGLASHQDMSALSAVQNEKQKLTRATVATRRVEILA
jgi:hypothetical protein